MNNRLIEVYTLSRETVSLPYENYQNRRFEFFDEPTPETTPHNLEGTKIPAPTYFRKLNAKIKDYMVDGKKRYVAVHPEIEYLISMPYTQQIEALNELVDRLNQNVHEHTTSAKYWHSEYDRLTKVVTDFKQLPWYKRTWLAMRGKL